MAENVIKLVSEGNMPAVENVLSTLDVAKERAQEHGTGKALVLLLDDRSDDYHVILLNAGMRMSECLALMAYAKALVVEEMRGA